MRKYLVIVAICLFILGPVAKILKWNHADVFMIASFAGLGIITTMAFVKKK